MRGNATPYSITLDNIYMTAGTGIVSISVYTDKSNYTAVEIIQVNISVANHQDIPFSVRFAMVMTNPSGDALELAPPLYSCQGLDLKFAKRVTGAPAFHFFYGVSALKFSV